MMTLDELATTTGVAPGDLLDFLGVDRDARMIDEAAVARAVQVVADELDASRISRVRDCNGVLWERTVHHDQVGWKARGSDVRWTYTLVRERGPLTPHR